MSDPRDALRNLGGSADSQPVGTGLPSVPPLEHAGLSSFLFAVKSWIGKLSSGPGRAVTITDLTQAGLGTVSAEGDFVFSPSEDLSPPPSPVGMVVAKGTMANMVSWTPPLGYKNLGYAEVWRGTNSVMSDAIYVGETSSAVYLDVLTSPNYTAALNFKTYYYRVRFISLTGVPGPWNAALGTASTADLIGDAFIGNLNAAKINAGTIAAGRLDANIITAKVQYVNAAIIDRGYLNEARIADGTITNAKIGNVIQSTGYSSGAGWQISKDGAITSKSAPSVTGQPDSYSETKMTYGDVISYKWFPSIGRQAVKSLTRVEAGVCNSGQTVTLPGYWERMPTVMVAPSKMPLYSASAGALSSQELVVSAPVTRLSSDPLSIAYYQYSITPIATLTYVSSGGFVTVVSNNVVSDLNSGQTEPAASSWLPSSKAGPSTAVSINSQATFEFAYQGWWATWDKDGGADAHYIYARFVAQVNGVTVYDSGNLNCGAWDNTLPAVNTIGSAVVPIPNAGTLTVYVTGSVGDQFDNEDQSKKTLATTYGRRRFMAEVKSIKITGGSGAELMSGSVQWVAIG
jgi:hypothetical protein